MFLFNVQFLLHCPLSVFTFFLDFCCPVHCAAPALLLTSKRLCVGGGSLLLVREAKLAKSHCLSGGLHRHSRKTAPLCAVHFANSLIFNIFFIPQIKNAKVFP
jgi:hypothetical protein